jgi:hypothetical protein
MTQEIIEMARQAATGMPGFTSKTKNPTGSHLEFYKRLTNLAAAKEREACAAILDANARACESPIMRSLLQSNTQAIRVRGQE